MKCKHCKSNDVRIVPSVKIECNACGKVSKSDDAIFFVVGVTGVVIAVVEGWRIMKRLFSEPAPADAAPSSTGEGDKAK